MAKTDLLAQIVYRITCAFPKHELFGITSQLRRASLSVPVNIVEGYNRKSRKELSRFIDISLGSLAETEYLLYFSGKIGYIKTPDHTTKELIDELGKMLWCFQHSIK